VNFPLPTEELKLLPNGTKAVISLNEIIVVFRDLINILLILTSVIILEVAAVK